MNLLTYIRAKPRQHESRQQLGSLLLLWWWIWHPEPQRTEKTCQTEDSLIPWLAGTLFFGKHSSSLISLVFFLCVSVYRHHVCRSTNPPEFGHSRPADPDSHSGEAAGAADNPGGSTWRAAMRFSCVLAEFKMVGEQRVKGGFGSRYEWLQHLTSSFV